MSRVLRPDQAQLQSEIYQDWNDGARDVVGVMPTGGGKSVLVSKTARAFHDDKRALMVMAHRQELVGQMSIHLGREEIPHRIIGPAAVISAITAEHRREFAGQCYINPTSRNAVAGVDTIIARKTELDDYLQRLDLLVTDETHHNLRENKWGKAREMCRRALHLGVTAYTGRADRKGLGRHADGTFDTLRIGLSMRDLIDMRALSEYEIVCPKTDFDIDALKAGNSGDYTPASMKEASDKSHIVGDVVEQYCLHASGKKTVVFATDVENAGNIAAKFNAAGIPAAMISGTTHDTIRTEMINRLKSGALWVLVNVDLLGEGFDLPAIECVIMARPTASVSVYLQQFGRALRALAGKLFGLVIDLVSNVKRHNLPDIPRLLTLDRAQSRKSKGDDVDDPETVPLIICDACSKPYAAVTHACPHCGAEPSSTAALTGGGRGAIEVVMGDLTRLDKAALDQLRKSIILPDPAALRRHLGNNGAGLGQENIAHARLAAQAAVMDAMSHWAGFQKWKGRDDPEIHMRFFHATGLDVLSALSKERSINDYRQLEEKLRSWIK